MPELSSMPMDELLAWVDRYVTPRADEDPGLKHAVAELRSRLEYLNEVGLGYLTSDRSTRSLSGGEIERVSLTTCLGASLTDTLFVLDEPTVGLHPRDTSRLISAMNRLKSAGTPWWWWSMRKRSCVPRTAWWIWDPVPDGKGKAGLFRDACPDWRN